MNGKTVKLTDNQHNFVSSLKRKLEYLFDRDVTFTDVIGFLIKDHEFLEAVLNGKADIEKIKGERFGKKG